MNSTVRKFGSWPTSLSIGRDVVDEVDGDGDVEADVGPELLEHRLAVVAVHGGVDGHDEAVLSGQAGLVAEQVTAQGDGVGLGPDRAADGPAE